MGYELFYKEVVIESKKSMLDIELTPINYGLDEVGVIGHAETVSHKVDKQVINVSKELSAEGGTAADALQYSPSIQVDGEGNVSLRGSSSFLLLVDGRPTIMDASVILNTLQAETIDKIEVITNPSAKYTSEGNTGIINIITKEDKPGSKSALVNAMLATGKKYSGALQYQAGSNKFNWFISGSYSHKRKINNDEIWRISKYDSTQYENMTSDRKVTFEAATLNTGFDYLLNKSNTFQMDVQVGKWNYGRDINSHYHSSEFQYEVFSNEDFSNNNFFAKPALRYQYTVSENQSLVFDGQVSIIKNNLQDIYKEDSAIYALQNTNNISKSQSDLKFDYELRLNEKLKIETGASYKGLISDNNLKYQTSEDEINWFKVDSLCNSYDFLNNTLSAYSVFKTSFFDFETQVGLRVEQNHRKFRNLRPDFTVRMINLFPSIHISKQVKNTHNFGISYSRRVNRASEWQLYPYIYSGDRFGFRRGNPGLKDELINSFEITYGVFKDNFSINVQPYFQGINEKIYSYMIENSDNFIETYINLEKATSTGVDIMVNYKPAVKFKVTLGGSAHYETWNGVTWDSVKLKGSSLSANGSVRFTYNLKNTALQFLTVYYAPSNTPQGDIREFYYFDFIIKQYFLKRRLSATLRTHNTFDSGVMIYTIENKTVQTKGRYIYEGPTVILSLSYKINDFKSKKKRESFRSDFDTRLDH